MRAKRLSHIGLFLVMLALIFPVTSCKSRKAVCDANRPDKTMKLKKNKSSYNTKYSFKSKPVRKAYVIRNKSR